MSSEAFGPKGMAWLRSFDTDDACDAILLQVCSELLDMTDLYLHSSSPEEFVELMTGFSSHQQKHMTIIPSDVVESIEHSMLCLLHLSEPRWAPISTSIGWTRTTSTSIRHCSLHISWSVVVGAVMEEFRSAQVVAVILLGQHSQRTSTEQQHRTRALLRNHQ